ncbi:MAG: NUDIX domain-containing protein [Acidimicrobiales bacterium]|nr:NUDIX domain-containing protein [Acidimicrobiales bacterium]
MNDELVEVIDDEDVVVSVVTRLRMRAENLRHRTVFVVVFDRRGCLLTHQRAAWKDVWPSYWDIAFGGVLAVGETYEHAARRELAEEAGIESGELEFLGMGTYEDDSVREIGAVFRTVSEGPFEFTDGEVVATEWVPYESIGRWLQRRRVVPDSVEIVLRALTQCAP